MSIFCNFINDIKTSRYILNNFINQELTVKYKRSALGFFWSLINPIATMTIGSIVFGSIMRFRLEDFVVFLYAGLLPWSFFGVSVDFGSVSILNNEGFIKKIYIPKIVFPLSVVCAHFINMIFSMIALFVIIFFLGARVGISYIFLPISFILIFTFAFGMALLMATANVYFRDMRYIMGVIMNAWYYLTPILYPLEMIPEKLRVFFIYNPCYYLIEMFRAPIYRNQFPSSFDIMIASISAFAVLIIGLYVFYKNEEDFVFRL